MTSMKTQRLNYTRYLARAHALALLLLRRRSLFYLFLCVVGTSTAVSTVAEETQPERIGLVLSGGGARGLAHVGVLQALEERNIKVDAIAGTSMGAIVGALYAAGRDALDVEQVARTTDWAYAFNDKTPRTDTPYIYRQLDSGLAADYRININQGRVVVPRGILQGLYLSQLLDSLFAPFDETGRFDDLPIPYRAVAADLVTGNPVVLDNGRLSTAVRASMSIPGLMEPVEWEDKLLVDGGIANNMPVSVLQEMGLDRLIVVDVGSPLRAAENIENLADVIEQLSGLMVRGNTEDQAALVTASDVLISPELDTVANTSFDAVDEAIAAGYAAANAALEQHPYWRNFPVVREHSAVDLDKTPAMPVVEFIEIKTNGAVKKRVLRNRLRQQLGEPLDTVQLHEDISAMYGLDHFKLIRYYIEEKDGKKGLLLDVDQRKGGTSFFRLGMSVSDDFRGNGEFGLGASMRMAGLNRLGGTAFIRGDIGTRPRLEASFVQPLDEQMNYFVEPRILYRAEHIDLYDREIQSKALARYRRTERQVGLSLGRQVYRQRGEIRASVMRQRGDIDFVAGQNTDESLNSYDGGYYSVSAGWDTLDDLAFPRTGTRWHLEWQWHRKSLSAQKDFQRYEADATFARSWQRYTFMLEGDVAVSDDNHTDFSTVVPIGGFLALSGMAPNSRWGQHRALIRTVVLARLGEQSILPVALPLYAGMSLEKGNTWNKHSEIKWSEGVAAGSVFLGAKTFLGPAYLSFGINEGGDTAVNLFLGQLFR